MVSNFLSHLCFRDIQGTILSNVKQNIKFKRANRQNRTVVSNLEGWSNNHYTIFAFSSVGQVTLLLWSAYETDEILYLPLAMYY